MCPEQTVPVSGKTIRMYSYQKTGKIQNLWLWEPRGNVTSEVYNHGSEWVS